MIRKVVAVAILGLVWGGHAFAGSAAESKNVDQLKAENIRLARLVEDKNKALDLAIVSIKKGIKHPELLQYNPFMGDALLAGGWEDAVLQGVGKVSTRPYGEMTVIRAEEGVRPLLVSLLSHRTVSIFSCGEKLSCFVVASKDLDKN